MVDRVSFSDQTLDLDQIAKHHADCEAALREYFSTASPSLLAHGRYWTPAFHRQYDFFTVFGIAQELFEFMDVVAAAHNA